MRATKILLTLAVLVSVFFIGCETDDPLIETDPRDKFLGLWTVAEECNRLSYDVNIAYDPGNSAQVLISNFANPGPGYDPVIALVAGDKIIVQEQEVGDGWITSGDGTYDSGNDLVEWSYDLTIGGNLMICTATYTR
jgi:hypothetical protein